jgi:hypothetical protein
MNDRGDVGSFQFDFETFLDGPFGVITMHRREAREAIRN